MAKNAKDYASIMFGPQPGSKQVSFTPVEEDIPEQERLPEQNTEIKQESHPEKDLSPQEEKGGEDLKETEDSLRKEKDEGREPRQDAGKKRVKEFFRAYIWLEGETIGKLRAISEKEKVSMSALLGEAIRNAVEAYELRHGAVKPAKEKKGAKKKERKIF